MLEAGWLSPRQRRCGLRRPLTFDGTPSASKREFAERRRRSLMPSSMAGRSVPPGCSASIIPDSPASSEWLRRVQSEINSSAV